MFQYYNEISTGLILCPPDDDVQNVHHRLLCRSSSCHASPTTLPLYIQQHSRLGRTSSYLFTYAFSFMLMVIKA